MSQEELQNIMRDFKNLNTKVHNSNKKLKEELQEKNIIITACQKEYQKIYYKCESLEEQLKNAKNEIEELKKNQNNKITVNRRITYPVLKKQKIENVVEDIL